MSQFFETICIRDGHPQHLDWHQRRVDATLRHFFPFTQPEENTFHLDEILASCSIPTTGRYRCKIIYDLNSISVEFFPYTARVINSLQLIEIPAGYDYRYKYADRTVLESLFSQRRDEDDILLTRDGWITDTSIANIAFRKGERWYTPSVPLLAGTTWRRLLSQGVLIPRPIHSLDVHRYDTFSIFNAMNDWGGVEQSIASIHAF